MAVLLRDIIANGLCVVNPVPQKIAYTALDFYTIPEAV